MKRIYYNRVFQGFYPVGAAAIVIAQNQSQAATLLQIKLESMGLNQIIYAKDMIEVNPYGIEQVIILADGNY